jgi:queuine tRNA-ribosyltransferase
MFSFEILKQCQKARKGRFITSSGAVNTPAFMAVGTQGTVKAMTPEELDATGHEIILSNTYHLYLRPGHQIIGKLGGLHQFMNWRKPILTDSGGFQIFSLSSLRKITEEGVQFRSHLDGSLHFLTPETAMSIQRSLQSDIAMVLDECPPYSESKPLVEQSLMLTLRWAKRSKESAQPSQTVFGIVQGGVYPDLRQRGVEALAEMDFDGYALGGLSVGEPVETQREIVQLTAPLLPENKPRYLMGIGTFEDMLEAVGAGVDMFDCVIPTRNARNGTLFTSKGKVNIKREAYKEDDSPLDSDCQCPTCQKYGKAYLRHLYMSKEILAMRLNTLHNLYFYQNFFREMRLAIEEARFDAFKKDFLARQTQLVEG